MPVDMLPQLAYPLTRWERRCKTIRDRPHIPPKLGRLRSSSPRSEASVVPRPRKERPAQAKAEMLAAAREVKRRGREVEKSQRKLVRDRDAAIRKAVKAGMPVADVGEAFGITQQRVSQILKRSR